MSEAVKVFTRHGNDWTKRFRKIANDAWHISAGSAIIDGEVVVSAANGATDFAVLQNELRGSSEKIVLVAFDLLFTASYTPRLDRNISSGGGHDCLIASKRPANSVHTEPYFRSSSRP